MPTLTKFASESVCAGHPDKIADHISDAILDACLAQDPTARTGIEVLVGNDRVVLAGEGHYKRTSRFRGNRAWTNPHAWLHRAVVGFQ